MTIQDTDKFLVHRNETSYWISALDFANSFDFGHDHGPDYPLKGGLRFRRTASANSTRTPSTTTNAKTWTWSGWIKKTPVPEGQFYRLFSAGVHTQNNLITDISLSTYSDSNLYDSIIFSSGIYGNGTECQFGFANAFRDSSAWYHIVVAVDTTATLDKDRCKIWVNGRQLGERIGYAGRSTTITQNYDTAVNNTAEHQLGGSSAQYSTDYYDGYMAEVNFIDGQQLTCDHFGYREEHGYWYPKAYVGEYGTNGFYLDFDGDVTDKSGKGNNWTPNSIANDDYVLDCPTDNYATWNPLNKGTNIVLEGGNLTSHNGGGGWTSASSTLGVSSGKWYWECKLTSSSSSGNWRHACIGISSKPNDIKDSYVGNVSSIAYHAYTGQKWKNNTPENYATTLDNESVCGVALDLDNGTIEFYKDGVSLGVAYSNIEPDLYFPTISHESICYLYTNFGQQPFAYTPPEGFKALSTRNLTPVDLAVQEAFKAVTYTGNQGTQTIDIGFKPDLVWTKARTGPYSNTLIDSVRGTNKILFSNTTDGDATEGNNITGWTDTGYTLGNSPNVNGGYDYVAWCWKAGEEAVTNNDGTIQSTVNANPDTGFSVVTWTGNGSSSQTVGHGLGKTPVLTIRKIRDASSDWYVHTTVIDGSMDYLLLNRTNASTNSNLPPFTDSTIPIDDNTNKYLAYCFADVEGFSKFGTYKGNGSADGPFIYTGFRPAYVMTKSVSTTTNWNILDNTRSPINPINNRLRASTSDAEDTVRTFDFLSNGFKLRESGTDVNQSGIDYIYMAFAEAPSQYSNARNAR